MSRPAQLLRIGADGRLRTQGRVYTVSGTAPGDLVEVRVDSFGGVAARLRSEHWSRLWRAAVPTAHFV